ncbi:hypothetical protein LLG46_03545 [bacterium]|nr:hypothetical protein [bacterium]
MIGLDSRYAACVLYVDNKEEFLGTRTTIDTTPQPDDTFYTVVESDRIDLIAYHYLSNASLWWVICDYNDIFFPLKLEPGSVLRLPSAEHVQMRILG